MRIGELAEAGDVSVETVRSYEGRGLVPEPARTKSGYRTTPKAVERLLGRDRLQPEPGDLALSDDRHPGRAHATVSIIELVYERGCPHVARTRIHMAEALRRAGRAVDWLEWDLASKDVPERARGHPSPTVLIGGRDVSDTGPAATGPSCRAAGPPAIEVIERALTPDRRG